MRQFRAGSGLPARCSRAASLTRGDIDELAADGRRRFIHGAAPPLTRRSDVPASVLQPAPQNFEQLRSSRTPRNVREPRRTRAHGPEREHIAMRRRVCGAAPRADSCANATVISTSATSRCVEAVTHLRLHRVQRRDALDRRHERRRVRRRWICGPRPPACAARFLGAYLEIDRRLRGPRGPALLPRVSRDGPGEGRVPARDAHDYRDGAERARLGE